MKVFLSCFMILSFKLFFVPSSIWPSMLKTTNKLESGDKRHTRHTMHMTHIHNIYIWHISCRRHNAHFKLPRHNKYIKSPKHYGFPSNISCIKSSRLKTNKQKQYLTSFGGFRWTQKKLIYEDDFINVGLHMTNIYK